MTATVRTRYSELRSQHPAVPAHIVLQWARHSLAVDALQARAEVAFHARHRDFEPFATIVVDGAAIDVYDDPEPFDWGDLEPTQQERDDLIVIGIAVRRCDDDVELESVWGVGFLSGDWQRETLSVALNCGFLALVETEVRESAYWAARDVETL